MLRVADAFGVTESMVPSPVYLLNSALHKAYREGDPQRGFRFKDGIL